MGYLNAAYDLLHEFFGYEYYADGVYSLNRNVSSAKFYEGDLDRTVIPSFAYRLRVYGYDTAHQVDGSEFHGYRLRLNSADVFAFVNPDDTSVTNDMHDILYAIPYSVYGSTHSNWYADGYTGGIENKQVCFTRDADGIATVVVNKMLERITEVESADESLKTRVKYFYVGMADSRYWCSCSSCSSYISSHGGFKSSTYVYFMNKVAAKLRASGRTDIKPVMLAYHESQNAPVKENSDGTYSLVSADMKLDDLVTVFYCPIEANYYVPFDYNGTAARSDAPSVKDRNSLALKDLRGWNLSASNVMYYFYMEHFPDDYMTFFDIFGSIQQNFRLAAQNNGLLMYNLGQYNEPVATGFARLKEYVNSKLMYNVDENLDELINGFFENYFGVANATMRKIFDEQRAMFAEKFNGNCPEYGDMSQYLKVNKNWFDRAKYVGWIKLIDEAYSAVTDAKNAGQITEQEAARITRAVKLESMSLRAVYIEYFSGLRTSTELGYSRSTMINNWKSDASELGMTLWAEHETLTTHYSTKWK